MTESSEFAMHLRDASFHAQQLRRSLERAREAAPSPAFERGVGQAVMLASRLQRWSSSGVHSAARRERKRVIEQGDSNG